MSVFRDSHAATHRSHVQFRCDTCAILKACSFAVVALVSACSGNIGATGSSGARAGGSGGGTQGDARPDEAQDGRSPDEVLGNPDVQKACTGSADTTWQPRAWRLGAVQVENSVAALVDALRTGLGANLPSVTSAHVPFSAEPKLGRFSNAQAVARISPEAISGIMQYGQDVGDRIAAGLRTGCLDQANDARRTCVRKALEIAERVLLRRPADADAVERRLGQFEAWQEESSSEAALAAVLKSYLVSPGFLFRRELPGAGQQLDAYALAEALAFGLTDAPPDPELQGLAMDGSLQQPDVVRTQVARLMHADAGKATARRLLREFFEYDAAVDVPKDEPPAGYDPAALVADTDALVAAIIDEKLPNDGLLNTLLTEGQVFASAKSASIYGLRAEGDASKPMGPAKARAGILTQPSWLAATSEANHNNPMKRGLFVLTNFACNGLPATDIPDVDPLVIGPGETLRDALLEHGMKPVCKGCHQIMDPMGFAFERFDHFGRHRDMEGTVPANDTGEIVLLEEDLNGPYTGPEAFAERLSRSQIVHRCFLDKAFEFYMGQAPDPAAACVMRGRGYEAYAAGGQNLAAFLSQIFSSPAFMGRREGN